MHQCPPPPQKKKKKKIKIKNNNSFLNLGDTKNYDKNNPKAKLIISKITNVLHFLTAAITCNAKQ